MEAIESSFRIFFDFGSDSSTEFGANKSVKEIATKNNGEGVLVGLDDQSECGNDEKEAGDGTLGAPIQSFKAGIATSLMSFVSCSQSFLSLRRIILSCCFSRESSNLDAASSNFFLDFV